MREIVVSTEWEFFLEIVRLVATGELSSVSTVANAWKIFGRTEVAP